MRFWDLPQMSYEDLALDREKQALERAIIDAVMSKDLGDFNGDIYYAAAALRAFRERGSKT